MNSYEEDYTSARRFSVDNFDCELPPDVRTELRRPRRSPILGRPPKPPAPRHVSRAPLYIALLVAAMVAGGVIVSLVDRKPAAPAPDRVLEHSRAILRSAAPTPQPTPHPSWQSLLGPPRAALVKLPPPHAQLIRLPAPRAELARPAGEQYPALMPYGLEVLATYRGELSSEDMLPMRGNAIGDAFVVGNTPWLWLVTPGTSAPQWVDP